MFDDDRVRDLLANRTPYQRGLVATLAAWRASVLAEFPGADEHFPYAPGYTFLVEDAMQLMADCATAQAAPTQAAQMKDRFEEILGTEDDPEDFPDSFVPHLYFYAVMNIDTAVEAWARPEESLDLSFTLLSDSYAFAGQFDDDVRTSGGPSLVKLECARQIADLESVESIENPVSPEWLEALKDQSHEARELFRGKFQQIVDAKS
jgi:hypothetical protein